MSTLPTGVNAAVNMRTPSDQEILLHPGSRSIGILARVQELVTRIVNWSTKQSSSYKRLEQALIRYEIERSNLLRTLEAQNTKHEVENGYSSKLKWREAGEELLARAREAHERHAPEEGWNYFKAATRVDLYGLQELGSSHLYAKARGIHRESLEKLGSWRRAAIVDLLGDSEQASKEVEACQVVAAAHILHDHQDNLYQKMWDLRSQLVTLSVLTVLIMVIWIAFLPFWFESFDVAVRGPLGTRSFACAIIAFGVMGSLVWGMSGIAKEPANGTIPKQMCQRWVTTSRLVLGALSALAASTFLIAGFAELPLPLMDVNEYKPALVLAFAFVAGFSERLIPNLIQRVL